jgi:hypothetical protein
MSTGVAGEGIGISRFCNCWIWGFVISGFRDLEIRLGYALKRESVEKG